jgi:TRAP-type C4-dicarboxylate transport system permease small subunit
MFWFFIGMAIWTALGLISMVTLKTRDHQEHPMTRAFFFGPIAWCFLCIFFIQGIDQALRRRRRKLNENM